MKELKVRTKYLNIFIMLISISILQVDKSYSQDLSFASVNYHQSEFINDNFLVIFENTPTIISGEYGMLGNNFGYKVGVWTGTATDNRFGETADWSQFGTSGDIILSPSIGTDKLVLRPTVSVGLVYQNSKFEYTQSGVTNEAENDGVGYSASGGGMLFVGNFGLNLQYKYLSAKSGEAEVGWSGLLFGIAFSI